MKRIYLKVACLVNLASLLLMVLIVPAHAAPASPQLPKAVTIATHPKGTLINALGMGLAKIISNHTPIPAVDRPYTGYLTWLPLLHKGTIDMGLCGSGEVYLAYRGLPPYQQVKLNNLRTMCGGSVLATGFIARANSGIKTVADLKGKRVIIDATSQLSKEKPYILIRAAGLDPDKDVNLIPVAGVADCLNLFMEGKGDASWASVGQGQVKEAAVKFGGVTWVSVCGSYDDAQARFIRENIRGGNVIFYKAGHLPEVKNDFWFYKALNNLITHKDLSNEAVYVITKAIWENDKELKTLHPMFNEWFENNVVEDGLSPYHPGSIRFYKEVGAWSDKMEKIQQKVLEEGRKE